MGGHPNDYAELAPPHSFIHANMFGSAKALAEYIELLDNNDHLYNAYFRWKDAGSFHNLKFMCRLCAMLQVAQNHSVSYTNLRDWWSKDKCLPKGHGWR